MASKKDEEAALRLWQSTPLHLTPEGLKKLQEKLAQLETILPGLISETARTRAYGDTSDNFEYKEAKLASRRVQRQILAIQDKLKKVVIINEGPSPRGTVQIGSTVLLEAKGGNRKIFRIVGSHETNPSKGFISFQSPLGAALMDRARSDKITVETPRGQEEYLIIDVR